MLHPGGWASDDPYQIRHWHARAAQAGVPLVEPLDGWQAALLAASVVIADHGSLAVYATMLGVPVLLAGGASALTVPGSASDLLAVAAPRWDPARPAREQLDPRPDPALARRVTALMVENTDVAPRLRSLLYEMLHLDEPAAPAAFDPVVAPALAGAPAPAHVVGATLADGTVHLERYPDLGFGEPHGPLPHRHLAADIARASLTQMNAAAVIAGASPADWPQATVAATPLDDRRCLIRTRREEAVLRADGDLDPLVLGSLAYVRLRVDGEIPPRDRLALGDRVIAVAREGR